MVHCRLITFVLLLLWSLAGQAADGPLAQLLNGLGGSLGDTLDTAAHRLDAHNLDAVEQNRDVVSYETAINYQGVGRRVIYVRPQQTPDHDVPAVVMLPYSLATSERMVTVTRAQKLAADHGVWVIVPQATGRHWRVDPNFPDRGEVGFISAVIKDATSRYPVDPDRVYLAGLSNGGHMVNRYLCHDSSLIAGAAIVAADLFRKRSKHCDNTAAVPMLIIQGTSDPFEPYRGSFRYLSADEGFEYWRKRNGCQSSATYSAPRGTPANDGTSITRKQNSACRHNSAVRQYSVKHGGHAWPGGKVQLKLLGRYSPNTRNLDATRQLWQFFQNFSRTSSNP